MTPQATGASLMDPGKPLILVTGATGYIGGRLVPRLLAAGQRIRCLARNPDRLAGRPWAGVEAVKGDVGDPDSLEAPFGSFEVRYRVEGMALVAEGRVAFRRSRIAVADYPAFRAFLARIDRAMARTVRLVPPASASTKAP